MAHFKQTFFSGYGVMKLARPITSQMCFVFSKYGILDFDYIQTFIGDLVLAVLNYIYRIIDYYLRIIFANTEILDICFSKHGTMDFGFPNFGIHCVGFSKHQNSVFRLFQKLEFSILAFPHHVFLDFVFF